MAFYGGAFIRGQMWAEMATNYFDIMVSGSLWEKIAGTDAGYIPLPQRLIVLLGDAVNLPPEAIPFYFTGAAYLLSGIMLAAIALPQFRPLLPSDSLRFVIAVVLMLVPDFETRTFINFTYFAVVPIILVTALAFARPTVPVPLWAWAIPMFILSKPAVLSVVPAMIIVALVSGKRFRAITIVSLAAAAIQAVQLVVSVLTTDSKLQSSSTSTIDKLIAAAEHAFAFSSRSFLGPDLEQSRSTMLVVGFALIAAVIFASLWWRQASSSLVYVALSAMVFSILLNTFSFAEDFGRSMPLLFVEVLDRRFLIGIVAGVMSVAVLISQLLEKYRGQRTEVKLATPKGASTILSIAAPFLLVLWFVATGWANYGIQVNQPAKIPVTMVSQWEENAKNIAADGPACVPIDPWGWSYLEDCTVEYIENPAGLAWLPALSVGGRAADVELPIPYAVRGEKVASVVVLFRPVDGIDSAATLSIEFTSGRTPVRLVAESRASGEGGLMQFFMPAGLDMKDASSAIISFDSDVEVAWSNVGGDHRPITAWYTL